VNDSKYGLQCGVFTHDWDKARALPSTQLHLLTYNSFAPHAIVSMS
jgi:acyl-CoA reductase-like NAD-dependent aldehyde dehydrogenase